jgi:hypothetical protein
MKLLKNITLLFILPILSFVFLHLDSYAASVFDGIETQINPDSGSEKIKKLQNLLKDLKLYNGNITGKYSDIESTIINYQLKKGLITHSDDW